MVISACCVKYGSVSTFQGDEKAANRRVRVSNRATFYDQAR